MPTVFRLFLLVNIALPALASCADEDASAARDAAPLHDAVVSAFKSEGGPADTSLEQGPAGEFVKQTTISGLKRGYLLYVPTSVSNGGAPAPVLVALHGAGDRADNFALGTGLKQLADNERFILIAPQALKIGVSTLWGASPNEGWQKDDGEKSSAPNDLKLILSALEATRSAYALDERRLYLCGFSRGAGFTGLVATASGVAFQPFESPFAAYAVAAGFDMFGGTLDLTKSKPKRPIWLIHGSADTSVPASMGKSFATALVKAGWKDIKLTVVQGAPHSWLWRPAFGQSNRDLWDWMEKNGK
jgi:poly(3-hydroxybutyrate) depolymerase